MMLPFTYEVQIILCFAKTMKPNLLPFIRKKWAGVPAPTADFASKTIIVTGSNTGLGFEAAVLFAALGAEKIVLGVRDVESGEIARRKIYERTSRSDAVEVWELDMARYDSIQRFAIRAEKNLKSLDVAVLNAGLVAKDYTVGPEGWEQTLQVNVLGTALLGLLLLPKMKASRMHSNGHETPHISVVASEAHRWLEPTDFPDTTTFDGHVLAAVNAEPSDGKLWDGMLQNARTKLFAMYVTSGLAASANSPDNGEPEVIVTAVCPGACRSNLMRIVKTGGIGLAIGLGIFDLLFNKSTEQGARVYVKVATLGQEAHGAWYKTTSLTE